MRGTYTNAVRSGSVCTYVCTRYVSRHDSLAPCYAGRNEIIIITHASDAIRLHVWRTCTCCAPAACLVAVEASIAAALSLEMTAPQLDPAAHSAAHSFFPAAHSGRSAGPLCRRLFSADYGGLRLTPAAAAEGRRPLGLVDCPAQHAAAGLNSRHHQNLFLLAG